MFSWQMLASVFQSGELCCETRFVCTLTGIGAIQTPRPSRKQFGGWQPNASLSCMAKDATTRGWKGPLG